MSPLRMMEESPRASRPRLLLVAAAFLPDALRNAAVAEAVAGEPVAGEPVTRDFEKSDDLFTANEMKVLRKLGRIFQGNRLWGHPPALDIKRIPASNEIEFCTREIAFLPSDQLGSRLHKKVAGKIRRTEPTRAEWSKNQLGHESSNLCDVFVDAYTGGIPNASDRLPLLLKLVAMIRPGSAIWKVIKEKEVQYVKDTLRAKLGLLRRKSSDDSASPVDEEKEFYHYVSLNRLCGSTKKAIDKLLNAVDNRKTYSRDLDGAANRLVDRRLDLIQRHLGEQATEAQMQKSLKAFQTLDGGKGRNVLLELFGLATKRIVLLATASPEKVHKLYVTVFKARQDLETTPCVIIEDLSPRADTPKYSARRVTLTPDNKPTHLDVNFPIPVLEQAGLKLSCKYL